MTTSFGALCTDFYVNCQLGVKLDLPDSRETMLDMFTRLGRDEPTMKRLKRYPDELALESPERSGRRLWMGVQKRLIRAGVVNPRNAEDSLALHRLVMRTAPFYLGVMAIDIDHLELTYGFDLMARANHNAVVTEALLGDSPLSKLIDVESMRPIEFQPMLGMALTERCDVQAFVEVKTRTTIRQTRTGKHPEEPISVFVTVRRSGDFEDVDTLGARLDELVEHADALTQQRVVPNVLTPLRESIASHQF
jgi:hypothetical protein